MKRLVRIIVGIIFIVLGLAGLVLPVLQGILFLTIGMLLLSPDIRVVKRIEKWLFNRYPRLARKVEKIKWKFGL